MEHLENLAGQLNGVIQSLKDLAKQARESISDAIAAKESFQKKEAALIDREAAVKEREEAVVIEARKWEGFGDIVEAQDKLAAGQAALENDRRAFERDRSTRQAVIDQQESDIRVTVASLRKEKAELEKEKVTYKQTILEDLKKRI
jgi:hypothetical protein